LVHFSFPLLHFFFFFFFKLLSFVCTISGHFNFAWLAFRVTIVAFEGIL